MAELTPMRKQYLQIHEQHPDCLLFFRLGDFYEMFDEDARTASKELDLTLTTRDRGKSAEALGILSLVSAWKCEGEKSVPGPGTSLKPVLELLSGTCLPMSLETKSGAPEALLFFRSGQGQPRVRGPAGPRVGL